MAVTGTRTVRELATRALRRAGVTDISQPADAEDMAEAMALMDEMLKAWQVEPFMWTRETASLTLTTAAEYTLAPVRPLSIINARLKRNGIETPMIEMTATEYDDLPQKGALGLPTQYFYDRQREAARLYVWPVLAAANGETIEYRYEREIEDVTDPNAVADVPMEWNEAVTANLAARIAETYQRPEPIIARLFARAGDELRKAAAAAMTEPVMFEADYGR